MISIKKTIYATLKDKIKKLRFLGQNDPKGMKKLLSLVAINFVYDWVYFNDTESEYLTQLRDLQAGIILNDCTFKKVNKDLYKNGVVEAFQAYRNVNTPQSNDDWKRVWDAPEVKIIQNGIRKSFTREDINGYIPIKIEFTGYKNGVPDIDVTKLTDTEKMNIYVDSKNGKYWRLDENCEWQELYTNQTVDGKNIESAVEKVLDNYTVKKFSDDNNYMTTGLIKDKTVKQQLQLATDDDINALL